LDVSATDRLNEEGIGMMAQAKTPRTSAATRALAAIGAATLAGALPVAGCAVGPNYRAPDTAALVPPAYSTPEHSLAATALSAEAPADRWWSEFGDPLLDALVTTALAGSPDLAAAEARVREARALARVAGAGFLPALNAAGRVSRDKLSRNGENLALIPFTPTTTEFTDYRAGFDASWEIDLAGRTRREVEAALARLGSSGESRNDARVVVAAEVTMAYVDYRVAVERLGLARRNAAVLEETLQLVRLERQAGVASDVELHRAHAEQASASAVPPTLEAEARAALFRLAALTGESAAALTSRLESARPVPATPAATPIGMPSDLLRRRPDVRRAERDLAAATADVGSAVAAQFPRLSLVGDFGWESVRTGDLTAAASRYWNPGPQLTLPLFAGGRLKGQVEAAEATRDAALASYRSVVLRAFADTETSLIRFANERARAASLAAAAETLDAGLVLERQRFAAGDASQLDVLAAERSLTQASDQRVASAGQAALEFVALQKALGGGWQTP
jgi:NodT family efflux transporter outer membrane factor (OMF) lipoprotein